VLLRRSGDGGRTWDEAVRVNTNPRGDGSSQHLPAVSVSDEGRVDLVFLDRRRDPGDVLTDAYLATSFDGGRSFDNVRLTSASFDSRVGPMTAPHLGVDLGSRLGISSSAGDAVAVWTDTRLGTEDSGRQDIASSVVSFIDTSERRPSVPLLALSAALGLLALGVAVVVVRRPTAT
jgi:hypothetical protein